MIVLHSSKPVPWRFIQCCRDKDANLFLLSHSIRFTLRKRRPYDRRAPCGNLQQKNSTVTIQAYGLKLTYHRSTSQIELITLNTIPSASLRTTVLNRWFLRNTHAVCFSKCSFRNVLQLYRVFFTIHSFYLLPFEYRISFTNDYCYV